MGKRLFLSKVFVAQLSAFVISIYLNDHLFIHGTPIVRADVKQEIAALPATTINTLKTLPQIVIQNSQRQSPQTSPSQTFPQQSSSSNQTVPTSVVPTTNPTAKPLSTVQPTRRPTQKPTIAPTNPPASQPTTKPTTPPQATSVSTLEQQTVDEINRRRGEGGLGALSINSQLTTAARRQSSDNEQNGQCDHDGSDGSDPFKRMQDAGFAGQAYGETVACRATSPQQAVDLWWASPPHHAILTNPGIKQIGLGWVNNYQTADVAF